MTEAALVAIISCLCSHVQPSESQKCMETYVNCAVVYEKGILTLEEFDKKCHFIKEQRLCYK